MSDAPLTVVVDAMCAQFGGNRTFVEGLLSAWAEVRPDDTLHVLVVEGSDLDTAGHETHEVAVRAPSEIGRPSAQTRWMPRLARETGADAVLATAPTTTVRRPGPPLTVVVHDLRHEILPHQFSWARRRLRDVSYGRSYRIADGVVGVSQRTVADLHRLHPRTRALPTGVAPLGADHVASWPRRSSPGAAVAFGHHTNKNPDLVIDTWAELRDRGRLPADLLVLGLGSGLRAELQQRIDRHDLGASVSLAPYLPDEEFRRVVANAAMVVLASDLEGFGLPVVEGMALGAPVVIAPDPGAMETAGGHASVADDWAPAALADAVLAAAARTPDETEAARAWAAGFTWSRTVESVRATIARTVEARG
ncbi:glycosyltransferase [Aeromicrobium sp. Leaf350]|uniref:glycosyltransferase n=1 Tax=Aeromicrobium sp. Leaf350 TaxID=2876565 RepID=UPI001E3B9910|nr:glycosyltransferase [Aeromicrobium sp. Leaf350]